MKNYELIAILAKLPAGDEVVISNSAWDKSGNDLARSMDAFESGDIYSGDGQITISGPALDLDVDDFEALKTEHGQMQSLLTKYRAVARHAENAIDCHRDDWPRFADGVLTKLAEVEQ